MPVEAPTSTTPKIRARSQQPKHALPPDWEGHWQEPLGDPTPIEWHRLRRLSSALAESVTWRDKTSQFGPLVGSEELRASPVHRWFAYKEGFSPRLLSAVIDALALEGPLRVVDPFGGVATSALAGLTHPSVDEIRSVEYSPLARYVGQVKLTWPHLSAPLLRQLMPRALAYSHQAKVAIPPLAAFSNPRIFTPARLRSLLAARDHVSSLGGATALERDFFLLGLAAVIEDLSGAMRDGRALRIKAGRRRRPSSLADTSPLVPTSGAVKRALAGQWTAMIQDLELLAADRALVGHRVASHLAGDSRALRTCQLDDESPAFPDDWANLSLFSPPYLNLIDYTEVYKMELWLMGHIADEASFRTTRLGTLRSHPSVRFQERPEFGGLHAPVIELARALDEWITRHGPRREVGRVVRQYFEDMLAVWREQRRVVKPDGVVVCVVANSTFSHRERQPDGARLERWRLPVLTDVMLAALASLAGFSNVEVWQARDLRPRNVKGGRARESLVVAQA